MHIQRPESLFCLFAPVTSLPGIGKKTATTIAKKTGPHIIDLLRHMPASILDRRPRPLLQNVENGQLATFQIHVLAVDLPYGRTRRPARIAAETTDGQIDLIFFHAKSDYLQKILPVGTDHIISGRVEIYNAKVQMIHPDYIFPLAQAWQMPEIEPVYPLTAGLHNKMLRRAIDAGIQILPHLPEWINDGIITQKNWPNFKTAMTCLHRPKNQEDVSPHAPARMRLAFDELFANQLALSLLRAQTIAAIAGQSVRGTGQFAGQLLASLPFVPTDAQMRVIDEIKTDQNAQMRMLRLLQGDVGSGKTFVALMAMILAIEAGFQTALLAPTEILARQHHHSINNMVKPLGIECDLLIAQMKASEKKQVLERLQSGASKIVIGTHALLSDDVHFSRLGLAVVDEQHRFGVRQRLVLGQKGNGCDILVMTATPIPRSLAMTAYGDLHISRLDEKPKNRRHIKTVALPLERLDEVIDRLKQIIHTGQRIYWICPLVEETDKMDISAAEDRYKELCNILPDAQISLVHGRMKSDIREEAMTKFKQGQSQILVATTVIEVGVDISEASIVIIEHAERFGLAQLHQLRGRVGRGDIESFCILLYQKPLSDTGQSRLKIMCQTNDGFVIAEEDLRLRGPGEVLGQRQSGFPEFALVDLDAHKDLIDLARQQAEHVIAQNKPMTDKDMHPYAVLLSLFERDSAVQFLDSG